MLMDANANRTNQAFAGSAALLGTATDTPWLVLAVGLVIVFGVALGPAWTPAFHHYHRVLKPWTGPGRQEDVRAPIFAQWMGGGGLLLGSGLVLAGLTWAGWGMVLFIGVFGLYAAATDWCLGCFTYRMGARLKGLKERQVTRIDLDEVGLPGGGVVVFHHPLCSSCQELHAELEQGSRPFIAIDISERGDLAERYGVVLVPTAFEVVPGGQVLRQIAP